MTLAQQRLYNRLITFPPNEENRSLEAEAFRRGRDGDDEANPYKAPDFKIAWIAGRFVRNTNKIKPTEDNSKTILVLRRPDGRFFRHGCDAPDTWEHNPLDAADMENCLHLRDANPLYMNNSVLPVVNGRATEFVGCELIEYRIVAIPTGRTERDLFKDGVKLPDLEPDPEDETDEWEFSHTIEA